MNLNPVFDYRDPYEWRERVTKSTFSPLMIQVAITGGYQGKESNPNLPETVEEQIEATYEAYKAGAVIVHIHARDPKNLGNATPDPEVLRRINTGIRERCPGMIINNTTGVGRGIPEEAKYQIITTDAKPDMASLNLGAVQAITNKKARVAPVPCPREAIYDEEYIGGITYGAARRAAKILKENGVKPEVEIFHSQNWRVLDWLIQQDLLDPTYVLQVVSGNNAGYLPSIPGVLNMINDAPKNSIIFLPGIGVYQLPMNALAIISGLHVRVGMEDNIYYRKGELCKSNAQQVERAVRLAEELNRPIATVEQARQMLGLPQV